MAEVRHLTLQEMEAGLSTIRQAPRDSGVLKLMVRRPAVGVREILDEGRLDLVDGLVGDTWRERGGAAIPEDSPYLDTQITLMNARSIALIAQDEERWQLAGDQLFVDLDLSGENLPAETCLAIGNAVIMVTAVPHTGCAKFMARYGSDAQRFVNSPAGRQLNLRGINARVVQPGAIRVGDVITKRKRPKTDPA